ncbi:MAG: hypothetical protein WAZ27_00480 [Minisyncoccia bacterium]
MSDSRTIASFLCPATGQICAQEMNVFDRTITLRRWTGGTVKATVCSMSCAQRWADANNKIITGDSTHPDPDTHRRETVVIVQHPDQVLGRDRR